MENPVPGTAAEEYKRAILALKKEKTLFVSKTYPYHQQHADVLFIQTINRIVDSISIRKNHFQSQSKFKDITAKQPKKTSHFSDDGIPTEPD